MVCVVILCLELVRRNIAQRCQQAFLIEPGDPFQRRHFDVLEATPRSVPMDYFGLEQADDRFDVRVDAPICQELKNDSLRGSGDLLHRLMIVQERGEDFARDIPL